MEKASEFKIPISSKKSFKVLVLGDKSVGKSGNKNLTLKS